MPLWSKYDKIHVIFYTRYIISEIYGRKAGPDGSVDSSKVSSIMKSIGQNPSEAEIQVKKEFSYNI